MEQSQLQQQHQQLDDVAPLLPLLPEALTAMLAAQPAPCPGAAAHRSALGECNGRPLRVLGNLNDGTRLPKFVRQLRQQLPDPGAFDCLGLRWLCIKDRNTFFLAAAIPSNRLEDFVAGEALRGSCKLLLSAKDGEKDRQATCCYAKPAHVYQQEQARKEMSEAAAPSVPGDTVVPDGYQARRGKLQMQLSARVGCKYRFTVKRFSKVPDVAIIKFPCGESPADNARSCLSMMHLLEDGTLAHAGRDSHLDFTPFAVEFVLERLKMHMRPALILEGAYRQA